MAGKDNWDKFDILFKAIVLGVIPIVIAWGADNIAQSLKRGELVQSLISDLARPDAKRDVALIALDAAIPKKMECSVLLIWKCQYDPKNDQVVNIAMVLVSSSIKEARQKGQSPAELEIAKKIILKRVNEGFYSERFGNAYDGMASNTQSQVRSKTDWKKEALTDDERESKANIAETLEALQPSINTVETLTGVRLVFIQYNSDTEQAKDLQGYLQSKGVSVPGIEYIKEIKQNSIRYANFSDKKIAENLKSHLEKQKSIKIEKLIDLSTANYSVPSGQIEVWLK